MYTLTQPLRRAARLWPKAPSVLTDDGVLSWADFEDGVRRIASGLRALGLASGDRVAMLAENSPAFLQFYMAAPWADLVMVTINTRWSQQEMQEALNDSGATVLIHDTTFAPMAQRLLADAQTVKQTVLAETLSIPDLPVASPLIEDAQRADQTTAALFYTGGTTGRAKGVMLTPAGLITTALQVERCADLGHEATVLHAAPFYHMAAGGVIYATLLAGARSVVLPQFDPLRVMQTIERHRVTHVLLVPTMLDMVLSHPQRERHDLSSLRGIIYGAAPMPEALLRRALQVLPQAAFTQFYGMTELSPVATCLPPSDHAPDGATVHRLRSAGQAIPLADVRIVSSTGEDLPVGEVGEIIVAGPGVMKGYWNQPELTAQAIRDGYMHTGDAGYLDQDGYLYLVDRIKDMIVSGGENVYSTEVENAIYRHPDVQECAVIGQPDERWGEIVCAIVVPVAGRTIDPEDLSRHCHELIAGYKCPKRIQVQQEPLPKTGAGKIQKTEIRRQLSA